MIASALDALVRSAAEFEKVPARNRDRDRDPNRDPDLEPDPDPDRALDALVCA